MEKILITGGRGQLAWDCRQILEKKFEVISLTSEELNITDSVAVRDCIRHFSPNIVLNCAAYTEVDRCETEKDLAWRVNAEGPANLAAAVEKSGCTLVHISTDYVFNGDRPVPGFYLESDVPNPASYYGISKLAGEEAIRESRANSLIIRTAWLYGIHGRNFLKTILKLAVRNPHQEIKVVNDQYGSLTWTHRLAQQIAELIEADAEGLFHATAEGHATWYETACFFLEKMKITHRIVPCPSEEYPTPARRPANSILENQRLKEDSLNLMRHWQDDLELFILRHRGELLRAAKN